MTTSDSGWAFPGAARKAHYFLDSITSLCGKWMFTGPKVQNQGGASPDDCAACTKKLAELDGALNEGR